MKRASQRRIRLCSSILLVLFLLAGVCAHAESLITKASTWRYAKGTAEASDPRSDWRNQDFDDSGWATGQAPFGYGEAGLNTTLGDMQNTYACFFLRKTFTVTSMPAELRLRAAADYDDGFIVWINGERVWDKCEPDGEPLYSSMAAMGHESGLFETNGLGAPGDYLEIGENVVAVQVFNAGIDSSDCVFDMALSSYNQVADTRFSADRGFYDAAFYVTISTDTAGATIRYTTDGTAPSASFGTAGGTNAVLHITSTTCLRVGAFKSGYEPTNIDTHTYIFLADVILQSGRPSGYPSKWGRTADGQIPADYDMDPDVRNDPNYGSAGVRNAMASLPSLSIVMDKVDMFGSAGVYNFNSNTSTENVEKATSVELIYPPGFPLKHAGGFQADCGITPHSHGPVYRPKRSFRLYFRREYGTTKLRYPFMESAVFHADSGADTFDRLVLRSGNNRAWTYPRIDTRFNVYVADQWGRTGQLDMSGYGCRGVYVHVYINGMYWGLYDVAERMDDFWAASYFGGEPEDWGWGNHGVGAEGWDVADPADDRWQYLVETLGGRDMTVAANYEEMKEYLDLEGFCDYITLQWYVGAGDWPDANFYYVNRNTPTPTPGRYLCWDPEWSWYERRGWCNDGAWVHPRFLTSGEGSLWPYSSTANKFQPKPFRSLIRNTDFRTLFADRVYKHLQNDGALIDQNSKARYSALCDRIEEGIIGEEARWGDHTCPWGVTNADNSVTTINRFGRNRYLYSGPAHDGAGHYLTNWYSARDYALGLMNGNGDRLITACKNQTMNGYKLYPSLDPPTFHQHGGAIATGFKLTLSNPNSTGTVYYTLDGTDPRVAGGARSGTRYTGALTLSKTTHVKARVYKSDSTWSAVHAATYNYTAHYDRIRITEILYNPLGGGEFEFVEVKNTGSAPRGLSDMSFKGVRYTFPPGTELGPGEFAVLASDEAVFTARYPGVKEAVAHFGVYAGRLDNGGERISLLDSDGVTVTSVRYNDKDPWPAAADGDGFALVAVDTAGDQDDPAKWRAGNLIGGSPGYDDGPAYRVVVSEALTHTDPPRKDAIELHNAGETAADIGGWYLSDSAADYRKFRIPAGTTLAAGGYAVFDETDFNADTNSPACFALDSHGDEVCLTHWDARGNLLYLAEARFGGAANGVAFARHVRSDGEPDFVAQSTPTTLGGANAYPQVGPVVINEIMYNPAGLSGEFVELLNIGGTAVKLYDPGNPATGWRLSAAVDYSFPQGTELSPGEIVLVVPTNEAAFRAQYPGVPGAVRIFGPYTGRLGNGGESLKLWQPDTPDAEGTPWLLVDRVQYNDNSPWPEGADGDGPSLERSAPALYGNDPANWAASAQAGGTPGLPNSGTLVSTRAGWKFWDRGAGIDSAWTQPAFDDRTWQNGNAPLGYPDTDTEVDTPVSYGDDPAGKHVTTYFRTRFALGCSPADVSALTLRVRYDDGYVAYLNGQEVARGSMPAGTVAYGTLASTSGGSQGSYEEQNLLAGKDNLVQGLNVLAVEVHQVNATSSDLFFDLELTYRANEPQVDPPAAPSGLAAAPTVSGGIHLSWNDNSHDETAFKIDRRRSGESAWLRVATLGGNTSLWTDTGLAPETTYTYRVKAGNAGGDSAYAPAADATTFGADDELQSGAVWKYRKGTAEASDPPDAWRAVRFDDSDWPAGAAPIGYGEPEIVTALGDMQTSYSSLFLRTTFTIQHAALIHELGLWAHYDDGFIMWINGEEVARVNAAGAAGSFVPYDAFSAANVHATWSNTLAGTEMPALADGTNVVCVQLFNAALTSSDALFEAELSPRRSLLPAAEDADQDALPDAWEDAHFGGTGQATDGDPDGDGMSNHEEYIAGTDPLAKPAEAPPGEGGFGVDLQLANGSIVVSLPTVEATGSGYDGYSRHYALEQAGTGTGAAWSAVPGYEDILGAGQLIRYTNQSGTATIYRARVWLE